MHRVHRFGPDNLQDLCASEANTGRGPPSFTEKPASGPQNGYREANHKCYMDTTSSNVPLRPDRLIMSDIITENIFKCITRCLIMVATVSPKY